MIRNRNQFPVKSEIYHFDTRQHAYFQITSVNVTKFQTDVGNLGTNVFNVIPSYIKMESDNPYNNKK